MKPPAINDPVTILDETGKLLMHCRWGAQSVLLATCYHTARFSMAGAVAGPMVALADEDVTWCRGHVSAKDDLGKALLVAAVLAPEKATTDEALVAAGSLIALGMKCVLKRLREIREKRERGE